MKCEDVHTNLGAFVLSGLEPEEADEVRRHLAFCPSCRRELKELEEVSQALKAAPPLADPPAYLKDEVLSRVRAEEPPSSRDFHLRNPRFLFLPSAAAAALVAIVTLGVFFSWHTESPVATIQLTPIQNEDYWGVAELHPQPSGNQQVELKLNNLEEPESDNYYEAWFASGDKYIGAGTFTSTDSGQTDVWLSAPPQVRNYPTFLITEQSATGDSAPSKNVVLRGEAQ